MKFIVAITLIATVASAGMVPVKPTPVADELAEYQEILAAIQSPSSDPATASALLEMLADALGITPEPIAIGPAIVDYPVAPSPVVIGPGPVADTSSTPLVQIILNINSAQVNPGPVIERPVPVPVFEPVPVEPVQVVEVAPEPIETAPIAVNPIGVVDVAPAPLPVEPVIIGTPIIPAPAVVLPEILN